MDVARLLVRAADPLAHTAISAHFADRPDLELVPEGGGPADVVVFVAQRLSVRVVTALRAVQDALAAPVVLVAGEIGDGDLFVAVECGVVAVLPRAIATGERIEEAVRAAVGGGGVLPQRLVGELIRHLGRIQRDVLAPHGLHASGLTPREIEVLRMMSDGLTTTEIAGELALSERAVKRVVGGVTTRLKLRNRPHAVAYALRMGLI
jgi:DNA-binding NarL/FixJ family response regulator